MCVGFWTLEHPDYALMLCSNRDEYLSRPTANTHWHSFGPITSPSADPAGHEQGDVLSGRDLLAGGTWAGVSRTGRVTLLTNITEPLRKYDSSRGDLTHSFLLPKAPSSSLEAEIDEFLEENRNRAYAGFNLLILSPSPSTIGDLASQGLSYDGALLTNSGGGGTISARMLSGEERRCAGLSNGVDHKGAIEWPKVQHGTQTLRNILQSLPQDATETEIVDELFALLTWKTEHAPIDRSELRNTIEVEPIHIPPGEFPAANREHAPPSNVFYGTRLSTVILIRRDGNVTFIERDIWSVDEATGGVVKSDLGHDRVFRFQIQPQGRRF
ncbi:NRDE protein-domain-containing protein [Fomes fomentarius]|nr:NRDE protein-domain-containing protein [Fomes fomentarius]